MKLSQILEIFAPNAVRKIQSLKLNFRGITAIDALPDRLQLIYAEIDTLSLNHNKLTSLDGICQFENL